MTIQFDNTYRKLGEQFFDEQVPVPVSEPKLIKVNESLANDLGISHEWLQSDAGIQALAGNALPEGAEPIATVYAGHQFGGWNPRLGDGRAVLLGEVTAATGSRFDIQLKGSGPTLFSRGGDGRAPLGPVIREYIMSEAMHALGVPTSRSLAAVLTGEDVMREYAEPGAVLTRVASSHIRFGTFQYFTSIGDTQSVKALAEYVIHRHYPQLASTENPYLALFSAITERTARLIAIWQQLGFIHGVMNTDNMLVCGETIDYGPCAFMDTYHPETVYSSIDTGGRYAYQNQPGIGHWNLAALAQCFTALVADDEETAMAMIKAELDQFPERFYAHHRTGMAHKIGLSQVSETSDELIKQLLGTMAEAKLDYTNTFTQLRQRLISGSDVPEALADWSAAWLAEITNTQDASDLMKQTNPVIIPRNHQVQRAITAAEDGDFAVFEQLTAALSTPFDDSWLDSDYAQPPKEQEIVQRTFCGT